MTDHNFTARVIGQDPQASGGHYRRVGVFDGDQQIGEYVRNYSSMYRTFCPFRSGDKWFALYSPNYTATRLMSLPDCTDIGGEEPAVCGFCPLDFYVPVLCGQDLRPDDPAPKQPASQTDVIEWIKRNPYIDRYANFGFVSGCIWGDDSSWKVQYLDLSRASEGIVSRDDRFGYVELPPGVTLEQAVSVDEIDDLNAPSWKHVISIAQPVRYRRDGTRCDEGAAR